MDIAILDKPSPDLAQNLLNPVPDPELNTIV